MLDPHCETEQRTPSLPGVRRHVSAALLVVLLGALLPAQSPRGRSADLVLRGGAVYTLDAARTWATAVAISGGRIVYVGADAGVAPWIGPETRVMELGGKMVLPGFTDAHVHPVEGGVELGSCVLSECKTPQALLEALRACAAKDPKKPWLVGAGAALGMFPGAAPDKALLDAISPDRPVYVEDADGHSAWVSSRVLAIAGIDRTTRDPAGGHIVRDPETGEPSGTLREDATLLVKDKLPRPTPREAQEGLRRALAMAGRFGITTLMEANASEEALAAYAELDRRGELTARVVAAMELRPGGDVAQLTELIALRDRFKGRRLRASAVKIFADGVLETRTAALLAPYHERGEERGLAAVTPERLDRLVAALDRAGFQVHVHAVGDRAVRMALDAFERARAVNGARDLRHHIGHIELIDPEDIPRFRRLGVIANFQPLWAFPDQSGKEFKQPLLGARTRWLYAIGSVVRSGAVVVHGSDWSVTSMDPLLAIQVAVTRRDPALGAGPPWNPEELTDLPSALAAYTINGAYLSAQERETGSIEAGKAADLIVLDRNLFELAPSEIHKARVLLTLLAGEEIFRAPS